MAEVSGEILIQQPSQELSGALGEKTEGSVEMSAGESTPDTYRKKADKMVELFQTEIGNGGDSSWEFCTMTDKITVWKKLDEDTGIYQIKFVGMVPSSQDVVEKVLFQNELRTKWDKVIELIEVLEEYPDGDCLLHFQVGGLFGIGCRDLVHYRTYRELPEENARIILDVSVESDKCPEKSGYTRAHTIVSAGKFQPTKILNKTTKQLEDATLYSMISEVDARGFIPKGLVNMFLPKGTLDWWDSLCVACENEKNGETQQSKGWFSW